MEEEPYVNFKNGQEPYISDINLNQMQKDIKNDIKNNLNINNLTELEEVSSDDVIPISDDDTRKKISFETLKQAIVNDLYKIVSTENGNYIKFESGTLIQFGEKNLSSITINTDYYGSCKRGPEGSDLGEFPIQFLEKPNVNIRVLARRTLVCTSKLGKSYFKITKNYVNSTIWIF